MLVLGQSNQSLSRCASETSHIKHHFFFQKWPMVSIVLTHWLLEVNLNSLGFSGQMTIKAKQIQGWLIGKVNFFLQSFYMNHVKYTYFKTLENALSIDINFLRKKWIDQKEKLNGKRVQSMSNAIIFFFINFHFKCKILRFLFKIDQNCHKERKDILFNFLTLSVCRGWFWHPSGHFY